MSEFVIAGVTTGQLDTLVKNIMRQMGVADAEKAICLINSGEWVIAKAAEKCWREQDGVIYFTVTSDGTSGPAWIKRLESNGFKVSRWAKDLLNSADFKPTNGVVTKVAVLKGLLWDDSDRTTKNIRAEAEKRQLEKPNTAVACLSREKFTDQDIEAMDLWWIVTMHEPIKDSDGGPDLLRTRRGSVGPWLDAADVRHGDGWLRAYGFAFVVPQVVSA